MIANKESNDWIFDAKFNDGKPIGYNSLTNSTTGEQNTAIGTETLNSNTEGDNNVSVGLQALYDNTTGGNNTAIGKRALGDNTTASNNTATYKLTNEAGCDSIVILKLTINFI